MVIPLPVRRRLHLRPGDRLDMTVLDDGLLLNAPARHAPLVKENGLLVHEGEPDGDLTAAVSWSRSSRDAKNRGVGP